MLPTPVPSRCPRLGRQPFGEPNDVANPGTVADAHDRAVASTNHGADSRPNDAAERVSVGLTNRAANSRAIVVAHSSSVVLSYDSANLDAFCDFHRRHLRFPKRSAFRFAIIQTFGEPNDVANPCTVADAHDRAVASTNHGADSRPNDAAERVSVGLTNRVANSRAIVVAHSSSVVLSYDSANLDAFCGAKSCTNPVAKRASVIDTLVSSKRSAFRLAIIQPFGEPTMLPPLPIDAAERVSVGLTNRVADSRAIVAAHSPSVVLSYDSADLDALCYANSCTNPVAKRASVIDTLVFPKLLTLRLADGDAVSTAQLDPFERAICSAITCPSAGPTSLPTTDGLAQLLPLVRAHHNAEHGAHGVAEPRTHAATEQPPFVCSLLDPNLIALIDPQFDTVSSAHRSPVEHTDQCADPRLFCEPDASANAGAISDALGRAVPRTHYVADAGTFNAAELVSVVRTRISPKRKPLCVSHSRAFNGPKWSALAEAFIRT
ncbi:hypothetical protein CTAYLR_006233 [Chrysophaeum taylorii]|uniref:Uncharacterized protein n=1 Tax=Chrysophaeum taylorii TaxID=2483200 RepID=A0AAD7UHX6_9STRA|nr:hypothetical protein CTAYLR_006233 [Chrysophaeum taylorii]